jgi:hypothetical protein
MAYYKVRIEVWCDWNPAESDLDDIARVLWCGIIWGAVVLLLARLSRQWKRMLHSWNKVQTFHILSGLMTRAIYGSLQ